MRRLIHICVLLLMFTAVVRAQEGLNYKLVDSLSFRYYEEQKWDSVIYLSKKAFRNDIDYYYLRMRAGIAYYEKHKYRKAAVHFKKAVMFNGPDDVNMEYLYFSYLFGGMKSEAKALTKKFSVNLKEKLGLDRYNLIDELYVEGGPTLGSNPQETQGNGMGNNNNTPALLREEELTNDVRYFSFGLRHSLTKNISLFHAFSTVDIGKTQNINVYQGYVVNKYRMFQRQYYATLNFYLGNGFTLKPAFHFINVNYDKLVYSFNTNNKLFLAQQKFILNDFAVSTILSKNISKFSFDLNAVMASLNNSRILQGSGALTYFPLGNLNLYFTGSYTYHNDDMAANNVYEIQVGGKIANKLWAEGFFTLGQLYNYVEKNAYITYNITDKIMSRKGFSLKYVVNDNIEFSLYYHNLLKKNKLNVINPNNELIIRERNNFTNHSIIGGIKWTL
ncbi:MAG: hypothetical protein BWY70_00739 [Bacteroidetes bacterium ADurb.Bin408]|nr:MAG: hypothetical protein BWY70_00739 [Bacteroidetes bacterium ADurb.Bin408]